MAVKSKTRRPSSRVAKKKPSGLTARTFSGLNEKRMASRGGGQSTIIKQGSTVPVQFLQKPSDFTEFDQHQWSEGRTWFYVPCAADDDGEGCPNCDSEDEERSKLHYKFAANVYNIKDKQVQVLEGPKTLATQIFDRYKRNPTSFMKRVFDVTKFPTKPVTYGFSLAEDRPVKTAGLKLIDIDERIQSQLDRFLGSSTPKSKGKGRTSLDDEEDFDDEDEIEDDDEFENEDELEDDEDEYDEDEEDDEEESEYPDEEEMLDKDAWAWGELKEYGRDLGLKKNYTKRSELVRAIIKKRGF